ncbi:MAG: alpha-ketoacid dehydrogenase subunit beta [Anaerofustis stercorihominis]|nr:alpha-ketoacid dehydrogenase subunit beta [Anaerofustis stercorihominis]
MSVMTYAQAIKEAIREELINDENVYFIGEDIGLYGGCFGVSRGLWEEFGEDRIIETPITEGAFTSAAVGMALLGLRPIVEIMFGDFVSLTVDAIVDHAAKYRFMTAGQVNVPMVLRTPFGSGTGAAAQHSQSLEAMYLNTPGLKVVMPSTPYDAKGLLKAAVRDNDPVMFFENKLLYRTSGEVPDEEYTVPIGKGDIKREGTDITLISYSRMVGVCLEAAESLEKEGINCEVLDLRSLRPLDTELIISSVKKTSRALIVYEAPLFGGFGGEICAAINESEAFYYLDCPVRRLGGAEMPVPYNPILEKQIVPTAEKVVETVKNMLGV